MRKNRFLISTVTANKKKKITIKKTYFRNKRYIITSIVKGQDLINKNFQQIWNLNAMNEFPERYKLPKLTKEERENLNSSIIRKEI